MLDFLDRYYSLDTIGITPNANVMYLTSHEHITRELARAVTDQEYPDGVSFFGKALDAAKREFMNDFNVNLPNYFSESILVDSAQVGWTVEPKVEIAAFPGKGGVLISVIESKWVSFLLNSVKVYRFDVSEEGGGVFIYDATTGDLLHSAGGDDSEGWNTYDIGKAFTTSGQTRHFFVCRETSADIQLKTALRSGWWNEPGCGCADYYGKLFSVKGAHTTGSTERQNLTTSMNTHGLIVNFSLMCDREKIILNNLQFFKSVFFTKLVIEFLKLVGASTRINSDTLNLDRETVNEILYGSSGKFSGSSKIPGLVEKYEANLKNVCEGIRMDTGDSWCFECNSPVKMITQLP